MHENAVILSAKLHVVVIALQTLGQSFIAYGPLISSVQYTERKIESF